MDTERLEAVDTALQLLPTTTVHKTSVLGAADGLLTIEPSVQLRTRSAISVISVVTFEECAGQQRRSEVFKPAQKNQGMPSLERCQTVTMTHGLWS